MGNNLGMVRNLNFDFTCLSDPPTAVILKRPSLNTFMTYWKTYISMFGYLFQLNQRTYAILNQPTFVVKSYRGWSSLICVHQYSTGLAFREGVQVNIWKRNICYMAKTRCEDCITKRLFGEFMNKSNMTNISLIYTPHILPDILWKLALREG